jgi:hypothetical protein
MIPWPQLLLLPNTTLTLTISITVLNNTHTHIHTYIHTYLQIYVAIYHVGEPFGDDDCSISSSSSSLANNSKVGFRSCMLIESTCYFNDCSLYAHLFKKDQYCERYIFVYIFIHIYLYVCICVCVYLFI